ncbi:putative clathrin assembly protein At5g35200 [Magnolia sinica]|uniref:putative clathrin assembly protein At5g35200 n=1 Tax=Magnolia sinica TaxID=86752 RepID=UPI00265ACDAA|nr:putative clathrin assembly protein At5g35200 [Magnolia sinica]XP_058115614.1 putative clathrin assembly protein At5g35200 [Magnolia sinica]
MAVGGTQLRKALGAIKDSTQVGLAKVNSDYKELDIAIVKATNHVEGPAKERHIQAIFSAISAARPRADIAYCIYALARRLAKTHNWAVAVKTLVVIHRALREVDSTFREELIYYGRSRNHLLNLAHFKDDSSSHAWDYSAWVRTYALFLEERLECFCVLKYDIETDQPRTKDLDSVELLDQLSALQQLLFHLLACEPLGAAVYNNLIHVGLSMVAGESVKIYKAISDGTINMVDKFFEMKRDDAVKALEIYRKAMKQAKQLSSFYELCKSLGLGRGERFIKIEQLSESFLTAMEEYVIDAPLAKNQEMNNKLPAPKVVLALEYKKVPEMEVAPKASPPPPEPVKVDVPAIELPDLLVLDDPSPVASDLDEKNSMALAMVPVSNPSTDAASFGTDLASGTTGWELALVTAPSSIEGAATATKLGGGLDKLTLDRLYDDALRRANQNVSYNQWNMEPMAGPMMPQVAHNPFYASNAFATPHSMQMAAMAYQQQAFLLQQQTMMAQQPQPPLNPFSNPYNVGAHQFGPGMHPHLQAYNPYAGFS